MSNQLPTNWIELIPQNKQGHWCVTNVGTDSVPYVNKDNKWAIVLWNRREECHYEFEFESGKMRWHRYPWDNHGLYYSHQDEIVDRVPRLTTPSTAD